MEEKLNFSILKNYPKERRFIITKSMKKGLFESLNEIISGGKVS